MKKQSNWQERLNKTIENKNLPIGSRMWKLRQEQTMKDIKQFILKVEADAKKEMIEEIEKEFVNTSPAVLSPKHKSGYLFAMKMLNIVLLKLKQEL